MPSTEFKEVFMTVRRTSGGVLLVLLATLGSSTAAAQVPAPEDTTKRVLVIGTWYPSLEAGLTGSQSAYSDNWVGGDRGSIVWAALVNAGLESQLHPKVNSLTTLKLAFGQTHRQSADSAGDRTWERPEKSTDLIELETIGRFTLGAWVDPFLAFRFESQFQDAADPDGRKLSLNPLRFKESAGIARKLLDEKDREVLSRFGFALRQNVRRLFVNPAPDDATLSETSNDGGLEWVTDAKAKLLKERVTWTSKLTFYQPLFYSGEDELMALDPADLAAAGIDPDVADFSTHLDADWEHIFTTQVTKLISVSLYLRWLYDKYDNSVVPLVDAGGDLTNPEAVRGAIRKAGQFKETLALGITYRIP
jgi:hypothetical protein